MDFGKIATKGQKHIPTAAWNAMREVAQEFENGLPGVEQTEISGNKYCFQTGREPTFSTKPSTGALNSKELNRLANRKRISP